MFTSALKFLWLLGLGKLSIEMKMKTFDISKNIIIQYFIITCKYNIHGEVNYIHNNNQMVEFELLTRRE